MKGRRDCWHLIERFDPLDGVFADRASFVGRPDMRRTITSDDCAHPAPVHRRPPHRARARIRQACSVASTGSVPSDALTASGRSRPDRPRRRATSSDSRRACRYQREASACRLSAFARSPAVRVHRNADASSSERWAVVSPSSSRYLSACSSWEAISSAISSARSPAFVCAQRATCGVLRRRAATSGATRRHRRGSARAGT